MEQVNKNKNHSRVSLSGISSLEKTKAVETPDTDSRGWHQAFTLIELLVVVLIIGILAAVALPQYQKAVLRSRYAQLMTFGNGIYTAALSYHLANGGWPARFDVLDVTIPGTGDSYTRTYGDYTCEVYSGLSDRADSLICFYITSNGILGYRRAYDQDSWDCMASTTWTAGNELCRNMTGHETSGRYGDGDSGIWYLNRYPF